MKRYLLPPLRPGLYNLFLSICYITVCYLHLINFCYGALLLLVTVTATSLNILCYRRHFSLAYLIQNADNFAGSTTESAERKAPSIIKLSGALLLAATVYYVGCILFGAPLTELYYETLYFSCVMTFLTIYPFCWYSLQNTDGIFGIIQILFENRCDNSSEYHLSTMAMWSIYGAWFGAFPIPLDWDRPWQQWPTTCCIGAILGCAGPHLFIGTKTLWMFCVERRKTWRNFV